MRDFGNMTVAATAFGGWIYIFAFFDEKLFEAEKKKRLKFFVELIFCKKFNTKASTDLWYNMAN